MSACGAAQGAATNWAAQMTAALEQVEAGRKVEDVARDCGVSKHTICAWKARYGGMDVTDAQEAKQLRDENSRFRKLVADINLNKEAPQSVFRYPVRPIEAELRCRYAEMTALWHQLDDRAVAPIG